MSATTFQEFGFNWEQRIGFGFGAGSPWGGKVTRYQSTRTAPHLPGKRRIGLDASAQSAGIQMAQALGFGEYVVYLEGCLWTCPPNRVPAVWLHDARPDAIGTQIEVDGLEWAPNGDVNTPNPLTGGILWGEDRRGHPQAVEAARRFYDWRITMHYSPEICAVKVEGYRESDKRWIDTLYASYDIAKEEPANAGQSTLRIGIYTIDAHANYPTSAMGPARMNIAGIAFNKL